MEAAMGKEKEYEIVQHTMMNHLEVLIVEMTSATRMAIRIWKSGQL